MIDRIAAAVAEKLKVAIIQASAEIAEQIKTDLLNIVKMNLQPGDKIVFRTKYRLSDVAAHNLMNAAKKNFPDHQIIVIQDDIDIAIFNDPSKAKI